MTPQTFLYATTGLLHKKQKKKTKQNKNQPKNDHIPTL